VIGGRGGGEEEVVQSGNASKIIPRVAKGFDAETEGKIMREKATQSSYAPEEEDPKTEEEGGGAAEKAEPPPPHEAELPNAPLCEWSSQLLGLSAVPPLSLRAARAA
jgi:hypothetical protein